MNHEHANLNLHNEFDCDSFEERIHEVLDARQSLAEDDALARHAILCTPCSELLDDYQSLATMTALTPCAMDEEVVDLSFSNLMLPEKLTRQQPSLPFWQSTAGRTIVAVATIAAILLISTTFAINAAKNRGENNSVATPESAIVAPTMIANAQSALDESVASLYSPAAVAVAESPATPVAPSLEANGNSLDPESALVFDPPLDLETPPLLQAPEHSREPELLEWSVQNWNGMTATLEPIRDYCKLSAELPGVRPLHCSFVITIDLIQVSLGWSWDKNFSPDLGIRYHNMDDLNQWSV